MTAEDSRTRVLVLGGTTEGREAARVLSDAGFHVLLSAASSYGAALGGDGGCATRGGALAAFELAALVGEHDAVVDATHPFAVAITRGAVAACASAGVPYVRLERPRAQLPSYVLTAADHPEAARLAARIASKRGGAMLLTTGSHDVAVYAAEAARLGVRLVARVLPALESLRACFAAGLAPADVIAMQGPSSAVLEAEMLRHLGAAVLVTKESGEVGGLPAKLDGAARAGADAIVVRRPHVGVPHAVSSAAELPNALRAEIASAIRKPRPSEPPLARTLMVQGTTSDAGKSTLVAGLCRLLARRGVSVAPFKSQNMANNSAVTPEGGEIGRAQAFQARAAGIEPHVDMNPVLLKPCSDTGSQVVVLGEAVRHMGVREYHAYQREVWPVVAGALRRLRERHDVVVIEGAGSPAEVNLRDHDIANMRVALHADAPVVLVADIERGGAFASLLGTVELLTPKERSLLAGFVFNRFRGDASLLEPGIRELEARCGVPVLGVLPYLPGWRGEAEDSLAIADAPGTGGELLVAAVRFPRISNATDLDALTAEADVALKWATAPADLAEADAIVLPGTKSTLADLAWLRERGLADAIVAAAAAGVPVIGLCGGYQMLGRVVRDPEGAEAGPGEERAGLGLLDAQTTFEPAKRTVRASGSCTGAALAPEGTAVEGYEIHMGRTERGPGSRPLLTLGDSASGSLPEGAVSPDGVVAGTYLHGLFDSGPLRRAWLDRLRVRRGLAALVTPADALADADLVADAIEAHVDVRALLCAMGLDAVIPPAEEARGA